MENMIDDDKHSNIKNFCAIFLRIPFIWKGIGSVWYSFSGLLFLWFLLTFDVDKKPF